MRLERVRLTPPALAFRPEPERIHRISLAWWDPTEPEGQRDPVLVVSRTAAARTLVVVWPTDGRGYLDAARLRRGEAEVLPWDLDEQDLARLRARAQHWPLDRHDLLVQPDRLSPCFETLRTVDLGFGLERRIEAAIAREEG